jgi:hypothetical protein
MSANIQRYVEHFNQLHDAKLIKEGKIPSLNVETFQLSTTTKPDRYGGRVKITTSSFWERNDYDDGSFTIEQVKHGAVNKKIRFGPLETTLEDLLATGFHLCVESFVYRKKHSLIIRRGREVYKLRTLATDDLTKYPDLFSHVRDNSSLDYHQKTNELAVDKPQVIVKVETKEVIKEVRIQTDPFEELMIRYPVVRKPVEFVGNQTIREYVKQQLKENRRLQDVE